MKPEHWAQIITSLITTLGSVLGSALAAWGIVAAAKVALKKEPDTLVPQDNQVAVHAPKHPREPLPVVLDRAVGQLEALHQKGKRRLAILFSIGLPAQGGTIWWVLSGEKFTRYSALAVALGVGGLVVMLDAWARVLENWAIRRDIMRARNQAVTLVFQEMNRMRDEVKREVGATEGRE